MDKLEDTIGEPGLVIALDSTAGNYDQLLVTTSLRGMLIADLTVRVLTEGVHSGAAGGIVPSSFRLLRQIISRLEDESTGVILPDFLNEQEVRLPIWEDPNGEFAPLLKVNGSRAVAAGLKNRPTRETARDTVAWWKTLPADRTEIARAGITLEREAELLEIWSERS